MTIEADFLELMQDTLTWERWGTHGGFYDHPTYAAPTTLRARLVYENRMIRSDTGDEAISRSRAWIYGAPGIDTKDRITLPDGTQPNILAVDRFPDQNGAHHERVFFGT